MTAKTTTTKTSTGPKALPWSRYSEDVDRQIAAGIARERARAANGAPVVQEFFTPTPVVSRRGVDISVGGQVTINGASDKQKKLIDDLLIEREHIIFTDELIAEVKADRSKTRKMIDFLLAQPRVRVQVSAPVVEAPVAPARARLDFSAIPDGNYAIRANDVVKFYRVSTNKKGFKNVQVRASDSLFMQYGKAGIAILHRIVEAGLESSRMLFVTELDRCCKCGRSLTDEESRSNARVNGGYGPDCVNK